MGKVLTAGPARSATGRLRGRHVIGSNFFYYLRDPWGSFSEYYYDLDYIPEGCAWEPRDFPPEDSLYVWGPPCPADFGENKEAWT